MTIPSEYLYSCVYKYIHSTGRRMVNNRNGAFTAGHGARRTQTADGRRPRHPTRQYMFII